MTRGFSLVELSIVLVILGLLTGGILAGQSLIRASELRAVSTEYQRYITAAQSFRDKYFAIAGDMPTATKFWGDDNAVCPDAAIANGTPGTCNGNGNGLVRIGSLEPYEQHRMWQQLALAGLIEGSYTGTPGPAGASHVVVGQNAPRSKLSNSGWGIEAYPDYAGDGGWYAFKYGNVLTFGAQGATENPTNAALTPEEAWNIDTKLDDGRPAYGKVLAIRWATCTFSTSFSDYNKEYRLNDKSQACALGFAQAF